MWAASLGLARLFERRLGIHREWQTNDPVASRGSRFETAALVGLREPCTVYRSGRSWRLWEERPQRPSKDRLRSGTIRVCCTQHCPLMLMRCQGKRVCAPMELHGIPMNPMPATHAMLEAARDKYGASHKRTSTRQIRNQGPGSAAGRRTRDRLLSYRARGRGEAGGRRASGQNRAEARWRVGTREVRK